MIEKADIFYANAMTKDLAGLLDLESICFSKDEKYRKVLKRYFMSPLARCLVAKLNNVPVGYALMTYSHTGRSAQIVALCVHPHFREKQIATNLLLCSEIEVSHDGASQVSIEVPIHNSETIHMLDQNGYEETFEPLSLIPFIVEGMKLKKRLLDPGLKAVSKLDNHESDARLKTQHIKTWTTA